VKLIFGGGDIVEQLEDTLARVRSGELLGVAVVGFGHEGFGWTARVVEGTEYAWARMVSATTDAQREMIAAAVEDWP
jgi:hypothetical protein